MVTNDSLIYILEDDRPYGALMQQYLNKQGFKQIILFHDENNCLTNLDKHPSILITDYHLNYMSGLKVIQEARKVNPDIYTILISGAYHKAKYSDDIPLQKIDKYIIKDNNELQELSKFLFALMDKTPDEEYY